MYVLLGKGIRISVVLFFPINSISRTWQRYPWKRFDRLFHLLFSENFGCQCRCLTLHNIRTLSIKKIYALAAKQSRKSLQRLILKPIQIKGIVSEDIHMFCISSKEIYSLKLFGIPIFRSWTYLIKVIPEMFSVPD